MARPYAPINWRPAGEFDGVDQRRPGVQPQRLIPVGIAWNQTFALEQRPRITAAAWMPLVRESRSMSMKVAAGCSDSAFRDGLAATPYATYETQTGSLGGDGLETSAEVGLS